MADARSEFDKESRTGENGAHGGRRGQMINKPQAERNFIDATIKVVLDVQGAEDWLRG